MFHYILEKKNAKVSPTNPSTYAVLPHSLETLSALCVTSVAFIIELSVMNESFEVKINQ